jgi:hypothetical protein
VGSVRLSFQEEELPMSTNSEAGVAADTSVYVTRFDGVRVLATDYHPV